MIRRWMQSPLARLSSGNALLVVAAALGVVTALLTFLYLSAGDTAPAVVQAALAKDDVAELQEAGVSVVVVRDTVAAGTRLTTGLLELIEIRSGTGAAGAFSDLDDVVGQITRFPLVRGEQVLTSKLVQSGTELSDGLAYSVPPRMRAVAVAFSDVMGAGGLVVPGDRVDVLISTTLAAMFGPGEVLPPDEDPDHPTVFTVLQNVLVLAVGRTFTQPLGLGQDPATLRIADSELTDVRTITLAVGPDQSQILFFAAQHGKLGLALRSFGDVSRTVLNPEYKLTPANIGLVAGAAR